MALKNNKLAHSGDVVSESQLTGNAEDLVKKRFLEKVSGKDKKDSKKADNQADADKAAALKEAEENAAYDKAYEDGSLTEAQLDSSTIDSIKKYATKHERTFNDKALKADLIKEVLNA